MDLTNAYDGAKRVRRTVVHLLPGWVAVLDEAELETAEEISLRWHTITQAAPDANGNFMVVNGDQRLACRVEVLDSEPDSLGLKRHAHEAPYNRLSNTLLYGERFLGESPYNSLGGAWAGRGAVGGSVAVHGRAAWPPNTAAACPLDSISGTTDPLGTRLAFTSMHPGGINTSMCDGAVRFTSENIDSLTSYPTGRSTNFFYIESEAVSTPADANRVWQNLFRPDDGYVIGQYEVCEGKIVMKFHQLIHAAAMLSLVLVATCVAGGCGSSSEVQRYSLSGTVTYQGKPVPNGMISFEPTEAGLGGGFAPIRNGKYSTDEDGRGHLSGVTKVKISGFEATARSSDPEAVPDALFRSDRNRDRVAAIDG